MSDASSTNRRLLIAVAAVGVVAGLVGIGASIAGVDDDRDTTPPTTTTTKPPARPPAEPEEPPAEPEEETPAPPEDPEAAEEAAEAQLEADAAVTRGQAEQIAQAEVPGPVDRARISDETGTPVWEVRIDGEGGHTDVAIDATTGAVLAIDD